jgi:putative flippase GtrA
LKQVSLFVLAGGCAAAVNVASRVVYSMVVPLPSAIVLAYLTGMVVAFMLNRWFVFHDARDEIGKRAWRFVVVNLLAILQTLVVTLVMAWLLRRTGFTFAADMVAHVIGVSVPVFVSYVMHKRWTFSHQAR